MLPPDDELTRLGGDGDSETRLASETPPASRSGSLARSHTSSSGWLSASGAIDHGRFPPGTVLGDRYRIVGRLGRGGMGEVFRADDLKLGQPVALKFLPPDVDRDPARLTQLHTEVRMARQVSHPNVCRVYDIDEVDGHTFLSMEYVDGEDLGSLLRRVGRFLEDRALEIARQMCAGLAAAHERGVVHRDFKPANVMIDGAGKVRITDFGLAGLAGETIRAGTPAYMAPEQIAGGEVTARSDIYALGLVLYELFTGQRALDGKNLAELIRRREQTDGIAAPTTIVRDLDPQIERAIMRCLAPDPRHRPGSALAVAASLPGGDPLAAALAAGETPSPEMVAAAGGSRSRVGAHARRLPPHGSRCSLIAILICYERVMIINRVATPKTPEALQDRAVEALAKLGYSPIPARQPPGAWASRSTTRSSSRATPLRPIAGRCSGRNAPEALFLWYRTSPRPLVPLGNENRGLGTEPSAQRQRHDADDRRCVGAPFGVRGRATAARRRDPARARRIGRCCSTPRASTWPRSNQRRRTSCHRPSRTSAWHGKDTCRSCPITPSASRPRATRESRCTSSSAARGAGRRAALRRRRPSSPS